LRLIIVFVLVQATSDCSTSIDVFRGLVSGKKTHSSPAPAVVAAAIDTNPATSPNCWTSKPTERAEAHLDVGQEKIRPVEAPPTAI
jgi:hypothetical protein